MREEQTSMKEIELSSIEAGTVSQQQYYSHNGELLISKDVTISQGHIDALKRRNIHRLYVSESEDEEINRLMQRDYEVSDVDMEEPDTWEEQDDREAVLPEPKVMQNPELKKIAEGSSGFEQLAGSEKIADMDKTLEMACGSDDPEGTPFASRSVEFTPADRSEEYKHDISQSYDTARKEVQDILTSLLNGNSVDGKRVQAVVEKFLEIFLNDRNILINISGIRSKDSSYLFSHTLNVCLLSINIAAAMGYNEEQIREIGIGALLHDIGMLLIPSYIWQKEGKLNESEWFEVMKHPMLGLHVLENVTRLPHTVPLIAYQAHERINGKGYPKQRHSRLIHKYAQIVQIADVFEALSSPRPHRASYIPYKAMEMVVRMTRTGLFENSKTKSFITYASLFPVGSIVELNDGRFAKVIKANGTHFTKPQLSVLTSEHGDVLDESDIYQVDLVEATRENNDIQIVRAHPTDLIKNRGIMDGF